MITILTSYLTGRLRPHFLAVCKPNIDINACNENVFNITNYICEGSSIAIRNARLSFYSGRAAISSGINIFCSVI